MSDRERIRLALSTGSLYNMGLDRVFALAATTGYDGVELLVDARIDSYDVSYLRRLSEQNEIGILSVHTPFAPRVEGWPAGSIGRVKQAVQLAEALGAETVVAHTPFRGRVLLSIERGRGSKPVRVVLPWRDCGEEEYGRWLGGGLAALQAQTAVRIAIENMPMGRLMGRRWLPYRLSTIAELRRWPYVVLDTTHWGTWGVDPAAAYEELKGQVVHVHLSDFDGREHRLPFRGNLRLEGLLRRLSSDGFRGVIAVETEPWAVAGGDWSEEHLRRVLSRVAEACRRELGQASFA